MTEEKYKFVFHTIAAKGSTPTTLIQMKINDLLALNGYNVEKNECLLIADKMNWEELQEKLTEIEQKINNDPELLKKCEEYQKKYGTLTWEDLMKTFTI